MKILVINSGSSSLKYQLLNMETKQVLAKGNCECIGTGGMITHKKTGAAPYKREMDFPTHEAALTEVLHLLVDKEHGVIADVSEIDAVGHRVVHGGKYQQSCLITDEVIAYLDSIAPLNPLHGPAAVSGMRGCIRLMPDKPQVVVFDTAFFATLPPQNYVYAIPYEFYEQHQVRRYGFHGTSHRYVSARAAELAGKPLDQLKMITCHLGNGSSITAEMGGKALDTSMGFTPQDGLPMGTRSGAIDPTIVTYLINGLGIDSKEVANILDRKSGLLGISGVSNDFRTVCAAADAGNERAQLAIRILVLAIKKLIGAYTAEMNGLDVLVFTAGIGENQCNLRELVCKDMDWCGIAIDTEKNQVRGEEINISAPGARVQTWVVPTEEEYMIALDTMRIAQEQK